MARRATVKDLLEIKAREKYRTRSNIFYSRLPALRKALEAAEDNDELLRYFPIGVIAAVESYFRAAYAEMIDAGEPFASRIEPLIRELKIDWRAVRAIEGKTVTSGELIAHSLPLSSFGDIQRVMNCLIGEDFVERLKVTARDAEAAPSSLNLVLPDTESCIRFVARTFELRHIFCHESATNVTIDKLEVQGCLGWCQSLLGATTALLSQGVLSEDWNLSQAELTLKADEKLRAAQLQVEELEARILDKVKDEPMCQLFLEAQAKWREFIELNTKYAVFLWEGGSGYGMAYARAMEQATQLRISELKKDVEEWESIYDLV